MSARLARRFSGIPQLTRSNNSRLGLVFVIAVVALASNAAFAATTLERIRDRHAIVFAYRDGAAPFSFKDRDGKVRGYSVELCTRIAADVQRALKLTQLDVQWIA